MKSLLLLLYLLPTLSLAQGLTTLAPGATGGGKVLASFPLSTSGPLITEDANTVAHVYWNGTALVDTKGNAWTMNGTVPQTAAASSPFVPGKAGAGPFSDANYYSLAANNPLSFAGDFSCTVVFSGGFAADDAIVQAGVANTSGWLVGFNTAGIVKIVNYTGTGATTTATTNAIPNANSPNVASFGRASGTQYVKLNLGTTASASAGTIVKDTTTATVIGRYVGAANFYFTGVVYELVCSSSPFVEATVTAIQQKVLGHYDGYSPLAVTRTTTATYAPLSTSPQTLYTVPAGVARITDLGLLVEPARTNVVKKSATISAANAFDGVDWVAWPDTTVVNVTTGAAAPMGGTWHTITNEAGGGSNVGQAYQTVTTGSSTTFVASAWVKKPVGEDTTHAGIHVGCGAGTPSACTCVRSDGGSCTASTVAVNYCQALVADLSTTPVRVTAIVTCSGAITSSIVALVPGNYGSTAGITDFGQVMHEIGTYPTSDVVTTTTALARNVDQVSATVPAMSSRWCISSTVKGISRPTWNDGRAWALGAQGAAGAAHWLDGAFTTYDATAATRTVAWTGYAVGDSVRSVFCNNSGLLSVTVTKGTIGSTTGAGTSISPTWQTTFYFGNRATWATPASLFIKDVKLCKATKSKECP